MTYKDNLISLPEEIKAAQIKVLNLSDDIEGFLEGKKRLENQIMYLIDEEKDEEGKKVFSNEIKRRIEFDIRILENVEYGNYAKFVKEKIREKAMLEIEIDYMKRLFLASEVLGR